MELATGGELFDRLMDSGNLSEKAMWPYAKGLIDGVLHCHARGVVHRDIKLENIMLSAEDPHTIKLIDFGLATHVGTTVEGQPVEKLLYDPVGTKSYRAPEVTSRSGYLGPPVDVWSIGIVLFSLVSGFFPLEQAQPRDWRFARLQQDQSRGIGSCDSIYGMYKRACPFSTALRELLDGMLSISVAKRPSVEAIASHLWLAPPATTATSHTYEDDDYADPIVYRSCASMMDEDEEMAPFEPPADAMLPMRQKAERAVELPE